MGDLLADIMPADVHEPDGSIKRVRAFVTTEGLAGFGRVARKTVPILSVRAAPERVTLEDGGIAWRVGDVTVRRATGCSSCGNPLAKITYHDVQHEIHEVMGL